MKNVKALKLLDRVIKHNAIAFNSYKRYTRSPATITGRKALATCERNEDIADQALAELRALLSA